MFTNSLLASALAGLAAAAPEADRVAGLPDMATFDNFAAYSGYLDITGTSKQLHYMFVESQSAPESDPLIIWFNGGPGCSSMLGWAQEHGPYVMDDGTDYWVENEYSWNRQANMLYIESPAGVGFSYCDGFKECSFTDESSSEDNLTAVLAWYEKFPEFQGHETWISGESYAGIYVPYLTYQIDQHNTAHAEDDVFKPNLKGFAVGNGVTNWALDCNGAYIEMGYWHSLYNTELYDKIQAANCDFGGAYMLHASAECKQYYQEFNELVSDVNIYDVYGICYGSGPYPQLYEGKHAGITAKDYTPWAFSQESNDSLPPCTFGNPISAYLNRADVREALHIPVDFKQWELCTSDIHYKIGSQGSQWIYEALQGKYQMLHYSGDTDGAVPTVGTQAWIATLGWETEEAWRPYFYEGQVAGYLESFEGNFTFATVHGAGHMVPQMKRPEAYHLISNWIAGTPI